MTRRRPGAYAELHCHSNFSFLDGASHPEELVEEAVRLGLEALALTDHDGLYGVVRFARAAASAGLPTVFGAELTLGAEHPRPGAPDPEGRHVVVLARNPAGYASLSRAISKAHLGGGQKGRPAVVLEDLAAEHRGDWAVLTGCRKGSVPAALDDGAGGIVPVRSVEPARRELQSLIECFGPENVHVELWDHGNPLDGERNDVLAQLARECGALTLVTNNVHYAVPARRSLATALAAVRSRRSLDEVDGWLPAAATAHLRSAEEQEQRFYRYPGAVTRAAELGAACAFDLRLVAPELPRSSLPPGFTDAEWLRRLTRAGAEERYGKPEGERVRGAYAQIDRELALIERLGFPGYFLIVHDIVQFCRDQNIYCQGRGSAANSAVCYALGITNVDAVALKLVFERFLSPEREGMPDIDIDIESDRREEVIQYVYDKYGRDRAAQVCNVVTYRPRSGVRDMAKALGYATGQQEAWAKLIDPWGPLGDVVEDGVPASVVELADQLQDFPRHLGIHSGGMVLCDRPVVEVCPVEWGRMEGRTVLQWDKEDCAAAGLVKFDLLGLGMLTVLHEAIDLIGEHHGVDLELATIPLEEPEVYEMLQRADTIGVFQVESRAQIATLPRLKPREFYDLVIEVALIRPGPIQGGSVHPYIRRRNGLEDETYPHALMEPALKRTLGVPLFQEQLMQLAVDVAGFTPGEADQLRQAMSSKRSVERMSRMKERLFAGMAERDIPDAVAEDIYRKLLAFANFGFPESHAASFAHLVYASAWIKLHYPACFLAALLRGQPMGFWSPQTLQADAARHGVVLRGPDVQASGAIATLDDDGAVRTGLDYVRSIGKELAERIAAGRPYVDMEDVVRRNELGLRQVEALATAGAFGCFGLDRRQAIWAAGAVVQSTSDRLPGVVTGARAPTLPSMGDHELVSADLWAVGMAPGRSLMEFVRASLAADGAVTIAALSTIAPGAVVVGGLVTHRQRPETAGGVTFLNLEDETGMVNVICSRGVWQKHRQVARSAPALVVQGRLERADGVINLLAERLSELPLSGADVVRSRDFH